MHFKSFTQPILSKQTNIFVNNFQTMAFILSKNEFFKFEASKYVKLHSDHLKNIFECNYRTEFFIVQMCCVQLRLTKCLLVHKKNTNRYLFVAQSDKLLLNRNVKKHFHYVKIVSVKIISYYNDFLLKK